MIILKQILENITENQIVESKKSVTFYKELADLIERARISENINIDDFITHLYELSKQSTAENQHTQEFLKPLQFKEIKTMRDRYNSIDSAAKMHVEQLLIEVKFNEVLFTMRFSRKTHDLFLKLHFIFIERSQQAARYNLPVYALDVFYTAKYKIYFYIGVSNLRFIAVVTNT
jgi:hypothetical protein